MNAPVKDAAYWAKLHIKSDQSRAVDIPAKPKRKIIGDGIRTERGGYSEENRP